MFSLLSETPLSLQGGGVFFGMDGAPHEEPVYLQRTNGPHSLLPHGSSSMCGNISPLYTVAGIYRIMSGVPAYFP
jgi:hypothetical protein